MSNEKAKPEVRAFNQNAIRDLTLSELLAPSVHLSVLSESVELARQRRFPASSDSENQGDV